MAFDMRTTAGATTSRKVDIAPFAPGVIGAVKAIRIFTAFLGQGWRFKRKRGYDQQGGYQDKTAQSFHHFKSSMTGKIKARKGIALGV